MKAVLALVLLSAAACDRRPVQQHSAQAFESPRFAKGLSSQAVQDPVFGDACPIAVETEEIALAGHARNGRCVSFLQDGFTIGVERFEGPAGPMPLFVFRPAEREAVRAIIIRLVGGPGESIGTRLHSDQGALFRNMALRGTAVVTIGYAGTQSRLVEGSDTLNVAADELVAYLRMLDRRFPETRKVVVGESLGGYIAAAAASRLAGTPLILAGPPLVAPRELVAYFRGISSEQERATETRLVTVSVFRAGRIVPVAERMVNSFAMGEAIFSSHLDLSIADLLPRERAECITLLYGTADRIIGIQNVPDLRRSFPEMRVIPLVDLPHTPQSREHWQQLGTAISDALEHASCPARGA